MQPVSFRNEIAALAAAREAYVKWLAKHKTSIEEDEAVCLCCTAVPPACVFLLTDYNAAAVLQLQRTANLPGRTAVALAYRLTRKRIALQQIRWLEAMSTLAQCVNKQVCHTCRVVCVLHGSPSPQSHPSPALGACTLAQPMLPTGELHRHAVLAYASSIVGFGRQQTKLGKRG